MQQKRWKQVGGTRWWRCFGGAPWFGCHGCRRELHPHERHFLLRPDDAPSVSPDIDGRGEVYCLACFKVIEGITSRWPLHAPGMRPIPLPPSGIPVASPEGEPVVCCKCKSDIGKACAISTEGLVGHDIIELTTFTKTVRTYCMSGPVDVPIRRLGGWVYVNQAGKHFVVCTYCEPAASHKVIRKGYEAVAGNPKSRAARRWARALKEMRLLDAADQARYEQEDREYENMVRCSQQDFF